MKDEIAKIDKALDELLVSLGGMVLRLAKVTKTDAETQALARSVDQFSTCALSSKDGRVLTLAAQLEAARAAALPAPSKPRLRLVVSR
jgi:hypothetical protein